MLFLEGVCGDPDGRVRGLVIVAGSDEHRVMGHGMPVPGSIAPGDYWWGMVPVAPVSTPSMLELALRIELNGGGETVEELGRVKLEPGRTTELPVSPAVAGDGADGSNGASAGDPLIAICMATYEPPMELFERQVESIREQTHQHWLCLISDDYSSDERFAAIERAVAGDERFVLSRAPSRIGFYRNFERVLGLVPDRAAYVALCDQDDRWYPDKLEALTEMLGDGGATLAYSDMRVVTESDDVLSNTYWNYRKNNHTDLGALLLANTVTGAASLFPRRLLDHALPFPPRHAEQYHDHWIALVALALGEVRYVDRPLYDYVQHDEAALGHASANKTASEGIGLGRVSRIRRYWRELQVKQYRLGWRAYYFNLYCRAAIAARVLEMRCGEAMPRRKRSAVRRIVESERSLRSLLWLLGRSLNPRLAGTATFARERALLRGLLWRRLARPLAGTRTLAARASGRALPRPVPAPGTAGPSALPSGGAAPAAAAMPDGSLEPILVDYFSRDGSTLMMRLLATSPRVAVEAEYPYERKYFAYLWRWSRLLEREDWPQEEWRRKELGSLTQERRGAMIGPPPWLPRTLLESAADEGPMGRRCFDFAWAEFSRRAAARTRAVHGDPEADVRYYAEKHLNTWQLDLAELPPLRLIVLLRDPRDTFVSLGTFEDLRGRTSGFGQDRAADWRDYLDQFISRQRDRLRWVAELAEGGDVPVVRYEDMVRDLPGVSARIGAWLDAPLDPVAVAKDRRLRRAHVTSGRPHKSIGRWKRELPAQVAEIFGRELDEELGVLGFERAGTQAG